MTMLTTKHMFMSMIMKQSTDMMERAMCMSTSMVKNHMSTRSISMTAKPMSIITSTCTRTVQSTQSTATAQKATPMTMSILTSTPIAITPLQTIVTITPTIIPTPTVRKLTTIIMTTSTVTTPTSCTCWTRLP